MATIITNSNGKEIDFEAAVQLMDDDIREDLHIDMMGCTEQEFFTAYAAAHLAKFGNGFEPDKANPVW